MSLRKAWPILPFAAALVALAAYLLVRGRGGVGASADEEAMQAHYDELAKIRADRLPVANERAKAVKAMEEMIAQAKKALADAGKESPSDDELRAEIEGNPEKYPGWKELREKVERLNAEFSAKLREAQDAVRAHMRDTGVNVPGAPRPKQGK